MDATPIGAIAGIIIVLGTAALRLDNRMRHERRTQLRNHPGAPRPATPTPTPRTDALEQLALADANHPDLRVRAVAMAYLDGSLSPARFAEDREAAFTAAQKQQWTAPPQDAIPGDYRPPRRTRG